MNPKNNGPQKGLWLKVMVKLVGMEGRFHNKADQLPGGTVTIWYKGMTAGLIEP